MDTNNNLKEIMKNIESKTEKSVIEVYKQNDNIHESMTKVNNIMSQSAEEFTTKMGRPMTYSEMRQMFG